MVNGYLVALIVVIGAPVALFVVAVLFSPFIAGASSKRADAAFAEYLEEEDE